MLNKFLSWAGITIFTTGFLLGGCAGGQITPDQKEVANVALIEGAGYVFDANPDLKEKALQVVTIAKGLLMNTSSVTHDGVVQYVQSVINAYPGLDKRAKRILDVIALSYIPKDWSGSKVVLSDDEKQLLLDMCDILITAAST